MVTLPDCNYYITEYFGDSIPAEQFSRLASRANTQLEHFERIYTVTGSEKQRLQCICALADAIFMFENLASQIVSVDESGNVAGTTSISIGSVSSSRNANGAANMKIDLSEAGQRKELYKIVQNYLHVYRGVC